MINGASVNEDELNGGSDDTSSITRAIIIIAAVVGDIERAIVIEVVTDQIERDIVIIHGTSQAISRAIRIYSVAPRDIVRPIVINANTFGVVPDAITWTAAVTIGGIDYSSRLTGRITIRRAVNAATLADLSLVPVSGPINPADFDGKPVVINYQDQRGAAQLFKGVVIKPSINMADKTLNLTCSDLLQETLSKLTTGQIDALIPHHRSSAIYQPPEDNYDYALECLRSAEGDIFLGLDNEVLYQSWTDNSPVLFTDSNVWFASVVPTFADRHSLVNTVNIEFEYRHFVGWHRVHELKWGMPLSFFAWLTQHFSNLPTVEMIKTAVPASLVLASEGFQEPPPSGLYGSGSLIVGDFVVWINNFPSGHSAYGFDIDAAERWLQTVTRKIMITVSAPASITQYGEIQTKSRYSLSSDEDGIDFAVIDDNRVFGTNAGFNNSGALTVSNKLPPADPDNTYRDWRVWTYRKKLFGKNGTEAIANAGINCVLREAAKTILASHQNVSIAFDCPIQPLLTLSNNASINAAGVTATGRIKSLQHSLNIDDGSADTAIELVPVSGAINQTLTAPTLLDNPPVVNGATSPALTTYLGGSVPAYDFDTSSWTPGDEMPDPVPDDDAWRGYVGNHYGQSDYQERFVIEIPQVQNDLRDEQIIEQSAALTINVILDKIGLTV